MKTQGTKWLLLVALLVTSNSLRAGHNAAHHPQTVLKPYTENQEAHDTTQPRKKPKGSNDITTAELDHAMKELDLAMQEMNKNLKVDLSKMEQEIKTAMAEVKKVDYTRIAQEVDLTDVRKDVSRALKEAEQHLKDIDHEAIKAKMADVKKEMEAMKAHTQIDMGRMKESIAQGLSAAHAGIEHAKQELAQLKEFINELDKDRLIDKNKAYTIEVKSGELYINGNKQSAELSEKYRKYFKKEDFSIRNDGKEATRL